LNDEEKRKRWISKFCWTKDQIEIIHDGKGNKPNIGQEETSIKGDNGAIKDAWKEGDDARIIFDRGATSSDIAKAIRDVYVKQNEETKDKPF
jgi:hypothetical protein